MRHDDATNVPGGVGAEHSSHWRDSWRGGHAGAWRGSPEGMPVGFLGIQDPVRDFGRDSPGGRVAMVIGWGRGPMTIASRRGLGVGCVALQCISKQGGMGRPATSPRGAVLPMEWGEKLREDGVTGGVPELAPDCARSRSPEAALPHWGALRHAESRERRRKQGVRDRRTQGGDPAHVAQRSGTRGRGCGVVDFGVRSRAPEGRRQTDVGPARSKGPSPGCWRTGGAARGRRNATRETARGKMRSSTARHRMGGAECLALGMASAAGGKHAL